MEFIKVSTEHSDELMALHTSYKASIGENPPTGIELEKLKNAIEHGLILFYGCICENKLVACCSVCITYSTFNYERSGIFEDFYILPEYRRKGIARNLTAYAYAQSGVSSLVVGCADCDIEMYKAIGFTVPLGNMLAFGTQTT